MNEAFYSRLRRKKAMLKLRIDRNTIKSIHANDFVLKTTLVPVLIYALIYLSSFLGPMGLAFSLSFFATIGFLYRKDVLTTIKINSRYIMRNIRDFSFKQVLFGGLLGMATVYFNIYFTLPYYLVTLKPVHPIVFNILQKVGVALYCKFAVIDAPLIEEQIFRGIALNWFRMKFTEARIKFNKFIDRVVHNSYENVGVDNSPRLYTQEDVAQHNLVDYAEQGVAVVASTLLFSACHTNSMQRRCTIVSGTVFAMSYLASNDDSKVEDNLETNTTAHLVNNIIGCAATLF